MKSSFSNLQGKNRETAISNVKGDDLRSATEDDIIGSPDASKKKTYRARGCRGGASRRGRRKDFSKDIQRDGNRTERENVRPRNGNSFLNFSKRERSKKNRRSTCGHEVSSRPPNEKSSKETHPTSNSSVRDDKRNQGTQINILSEQSSHKNIASNESFLHVPFQHSQNDHLSPSKPKSLSASSKISANTESTNAKTKKTDTTTAKDSNASPNEIFSGNIDNSKHAEKSDSDDTKEMQVCIVSSLNKTNETEAILMPRSTAAKAAGHLKKGSRAREEETEEGFSFFTISPRSYLTGRRKAKMQRIN